MFRPCRGFDGLDVNPECSDYFIWRNFVVDKPEHRDLRAEMLGDLLLQSTQQRVVEVAWTSRGYQRKRHKDERKDCNCWDRMPLSRGVNSPEELWSLLRDGRDAVTQIPAECFDTDFYQYPSKREAGKSYTFSAGVLDDIAGFDAAFFGRAPREATQMDPQQRLLLELAWEAFEHAGLRPLDMRGCDCSVFVGVASPDYGNRSMDDLNSVDPYSATGNTLSIASNRVSCLFDLRGPSLSVDTACSPSLVALHQAVQQALRSGEAEMALAGGVNLLMHPFGFVSFSKASMLSPRGRCRAFDASGDGYVRSEGGTFVLLKSLERALADGDTIHAVIAGSGVNSDGHTQGRISVPGAATQAELLRSVYARAGVDPRAVSYLESHSTGTAVGDPIEARVLIEVLSAGRLADKPLLIGSIKTSIGHLETALGMATLLKAVLCLKYPARCTSRCPIPPSISRAAGCAWSSATPRSTARTTGRRSRSASIPSVSAAPMPTWC